MRYSKEEKAKRLEDWENSGKSAWAYAKANNLNPQTFTKWTKKESPIHFVEVSAQVPPSQGHVHHIRIEKGDIKIYIPLGLRSGELSTVMEGLGVRL